MLRSTDNSICMDKENTLTSPPPLKAIDCMSGVSLSDGHCDVAQLHAATQLRRLSADEQTQRQRQQLPLEDTTNLIKSHYGLPVGKVQPTLRNQVMRCSLFKISNLRPRRIPPTATSIRSYYLRGSSRHRAILATISSSKFFKPPSTVSRIVFQYVFSRDL